MPSSSILKQNLALIRQKSAPLAILLSLTKESSHPLKLCDMELPDQYTRLLFYGLYPKRVEKLIHWLEQSPKREIVIFEDDLGLMKSLVSLSRIYLLLEHPRVHFFYLQEGDFWNRRKREVQKILSQPYELYFWPVESPIRESNFSDLKEKLINTSIDQNINCSEYLETSPLVYENFLQNLLQLDGSKNIHELSCAFKNIPAIVVGAGPSLHESAPLLSTLQDKALLFSGGRALSTLNHLHIQPHFALGVDPYEQHASTLRCNNFFELPLIYRSRMHHEAVSLMHGSHLYTSGAIGYPFLPWIEEKLGLHFPVVQEGLNVVNFSIVLAHYFGCSPIILVGSDLGYTGQKAYSEAIPDEQNLPNEFQIDPEDHSLNRGVMAKDHEGRPLFTLWKWSEEAKWIDEYAKAHNIHLINSTKSGLKIGEIEHRSLESVKKAFLIQSFDLSARVHTEIENLSKIHVPRSKIFEELATFYGAIKEAHVQFEEYLSVLEEDQAVAPIEIALEENEAISLLLSHHKELFERLEMEENATLRERKKTLFLIKQLQVYEDVFKRAIQAT